MSFRVSISTNADCVRIDLLDSYIEESAVRAFDEAFVLLGTGDLALSMVPVAGCLTDNSSHD